MRFDLLIKNGTLVTSAASFPADIGVVNGKIVFVGKADAAQQADEVYDATGKHVLPGVIDAHVHFREPGLVHKEDFLTGSEAAAFGGVTLFADMPNTIPVTSTVTRFNEKLMLAREKSYVDFAFFALLAEDNYDEIEGLQKAGALGLKVFLGSSTGDLAAPPQGVMYEQMCKAAALGMRIGFHCENNALNAHFTALCKNAPNNADPALLAQARPAISEADAIAQAIRFAEYTGAKIHIHHVSSALGVELVRNAKKNELQITAETCPQYLLLDDNDYPRLGTAMKVYPPIRSRADRNALWDALLDGTIDIIASDHAPHTTEEKNLPLWDASSGLSGVETMLRLMLNETHKGRITLNDIVRLTSEGPARVWGLYPQKGGAVLSNDDKNGCDADFTIVDMEKTGVIRSSELHSKNKISVFDGVETKGMPVTTIVRGCFVMRNSELCGKRGFGKPCFSKSGFGKVVTR